MHFPTVIPHATLLIATLAISGLALGDEAPRKAIETSAREAGYELTRLSERLDLLSTDQGSYTTNTLILHGAGALLLVDTQKADDANGLRRIVDAYGLGAPRFIINTHRHTEHIGGNALWGDGPIVIAHEKVPEKLREGAAIFDELPEAAFPELLISSDLTLRCAGETLRIHEFGGSHDDNEIIVHFVESRVVHLSSLTNGFNFPSSDSDGDPLAFAPLVERALETLPADVRIVSGHNRTGTVDDLRAYLTMLRATRSAVEDGLASGQSVEELQQAEILSAWESYAESYVSSDAWIASLARALTRKPGNEPESSHVYRALFDAWKSRGPHAAVERYRALKSSPEASFIDETTLLVIGDKLLDRRLEGDAVVFLEASVLEESESRYAYYAAYDLARALDRLGERSRAIEACRQALALKPEFDAGRKLLTKLRQGQE